VQELRADQPERDQAAARQLRHGIAEAGRLTVLTKSARTVA
jgi:hypothetical protein